MNSFDTLIAQLGTQSQQPEIPGIILSILITCVSSLILFLLYEWFYKYKQTGSQIHRSFFLIGPATTSIFIAIQFSLPLSLGLLGALSFIRFRTPVKDPEEIGYMLALIALSISSATFNYLIVLILLAVIVGMLIAKEYFVANRLTGYGVGYLLISAKEGQINEDSFQLTLKRFLKNIKILSINSDNELTNIHSKMQAPLIAIN